MWCAFQTTLLYAAGLARNVFFHKRFRHTRRMKYVYYTAWSMFVVMWAGGIIMRFGEAGIYVCADSEPTNLTFNSNPDWEEQIHKDRLVLLNHKSCDFIRIFVDIVGAYFGGYIAWVALGIAGASRTPTWSPNREVDRHWKDI